MGVGTTLLKIVKANYNVIAGNEPKSNIKIIASNSLLPSLFLVCFTSKDAPLLVRSVRA